MPGAMWAGYRSFTCNFAHIFSVSAKVAQLLRRSLFWQYTAGAAPDLREAMDPLFTDATSFMTGRALGGKSGGFTEGLS